MEPKSRLLTLSFRVERESRLQNRRANGWSAEAEEWGNGERHAPPGPRLQEERLFKCGQDHVVINRSKEISKRSLFVLTFELCEGPCRCCC